LNGINAVTTRSILESMPGAGSSGYPNVGDKAGGANYTVQLVNPGGYVYTRLTTASPTACTAIETNANGRFVNVTGAAAANAVTLSIFDEGASPTCAAADLIWSGTIPISTSPMLPFNIPTTAGLAYSLSGALTSTIIITRN
jgi:hypothetical protein